MRAKLLLSTAAVALILAGPAAFAQSNPDKKPDGAKEQTLAKPAQPDKGAERKAEEKKATADKSQPKATEQPKQRSEQKNSENKTAAQREDKQQNAQKPSAERNAKDTKAQRNKAAETNKRSTTGQSTTEQQKTSSQPQQASPNVAEQNKTSTTNKTNAGNNKTSVPTTANATSTKSTTQQNSASVSAQQLQPDKRVKISETISRTRDVAPPIHDLRVSINIGTPIPERVRLHRLPTEIVTIEPAFREFDYFTTEEDIVIVNPRTREVVTMVPRDASRARAEFSSTQVSSAGPNDASPCQVLRREASGQMMPVNPADLSRSTTGSGASDLNRLAVTVQAPNGQTMPPVQLGDRSGQIVVATDGRDCTITIEPSAR